MNITLVLADLQLGSMNATEVQDGSTLVNLLLQQMSSRAVSRLNILSVFVDGPIFIKLL